MAKRSRKSKNTIIIFDLFAQFLSDDSVEVEVQSQDSFGLVYDSADTLTDSCFKDSAFVTIVGFKKPHV